MYCTQETKELLDEIACLKGQLKKREEEAEELSASMAAANARLEQQATWAKTLEEEAKAGMVEAQEESKRLRELLSAAESGQEAAAAARARQVQVLQEEVRRSAGEARRLERLGEEAHMARGLAQASATKSQAELRALKLLLPSDPELPGMIAGTSASFTPPLSISLPSYLVESKLHVYCCMLLHV